MSQQGWASFCEIHPRRLAGQALTVSQELNPTQTPTFNSTIEDQDSILTTHTKGVIICG